MEKYKLKVTRRFERDFRKLEIKLKIRLDSAIRKLAEDPKMGKPLRVELSGKWSLGVGDYRIIYTIDEKEKVVILYNVRHRKKFTGKLAFKSRPEHYFAGKLYTFAL
ncbi:MAG: type II toxin-antitoxin system RelE/ParE family toxin [Nitrososphaeria archaeon]